MFATEFGQNTLDEVNLIAGGRNYGWPVVEGEGDTRGGQFTNPLVTWTPAEASPSGLAFAQESSGGALYVAGLRGERLWRIPVAADGTTGEPEPQLVGQYGRLRTAAVSPDGSLWITTSNSDGRGDGSPDRLIQLNRGAAAQATPEPSAS
jgi:glucose/arabinose dehydrogenase